MHSVTSTEQWKPFSCHCVKCGNAVTGYKNNRGDIKVECKKCHTAMVRKLKTPSHETFDVYTTKCIKQIG